MKNSLMIFATLALMAFASGGAAKTQAGCDGQSQSELNACAGANYARADKALNQVYKKLISRMSDNPAEVGKLRKAQRLWLVFRDADCDFSGWQARGGSMEPMVVSDCLTKNTQERTKSLEATLKTLQSM